MKKGNENGKEIYRKKPFSGEITRDLGKEHLDFIAEFRRIPKGLLKLTPDFLTDKFGVPGIEEKNPDLKVIVFCKDKELRRILIDFGNRGANLTKIWDVLKSPDIPEYLIDGHPIGLQLHEGELSPYWNDAVKGFDAKRKAFLEKEKAIRGAIKLIMSLKPITLKHFYQGEILWVNGKLSMAQAALDDVIDIYLDAKAIQDGLIGYPAKWGMPISKLVREKFRPFSQKSHKIWNRRILALVDELIRIGYSDKQAYIKTGKLLNLAFPHLYKDSDPDRVRQRYKASRKTRV